MSTRDFFKNSVLEAFGQVDPAKIGLSLLVALAMGILIYYVYMPTSVTAKLREYTTPVKKRLYT